MRWAIALVVSASACAAATLPTTWRSPDVGAVTLAGHKVVALFIGEPPALRRNAEDAMARALTDQDANGVPAYQLLHDSEVRSGDLPWRKLVSLDVSAAVVLRVVERQADRTVSLETRVYTLGQDKLVWSSTSRAVAASAIGPLIDRVVAADARAMAKDGLLPPPEDDWGSDIGSDIGLGR